MTLENAGESKRNMQVQNVKRKKKMLKEKEEKEEKNRKLQTSVVLERLYGNSSKLSRFQQISML